MTVTIATNATKRRNERRGLRSMLAELLAVEFAESRLLASTNRAAACSGEQPADK
jgi:hypothetical protein